LKIPNIHSYIVTIKDDTSFIDNKIPTLKFPGELPYTIIQGINGSKLSAQDYIDLNIGKDPDWKVKEGVFDIIQTDWWEHEVYDGELGCAISHVKAWETAYNDGVDYALILEDDFKYKSQTPWEEVFEIIPNYDLTYLGRVKVRKQVPETPVLGHSDWVIPSYSFNTSSYILSKEAIKILVEEYVPIFRHNLITPDEFLNIADRKTPRTDILEKYKHLPVLSVIAPLIEYIGQSSTGEGVIVSKPKIYNDNNVKEWKDNYLSPSLNLVNYPYIIENLSQEIYTHPLFTSQFCKELLEVSVKDPWEIVDNYLVQSLDKLGLNKVINKVIGSYLLNLWDGIWNIKPRTLNWQTTKSYIILSTQNSPIGGFQHDECDIKLEVRLNEYQFGNKVFPKYKFTTPELRVGDALIYPGKITHKSGYKPSTTKICNLVSYINLNKNG